MPFPWLAGQRITAARLDEAATRLVAQDADLVMTNQTSLVNSDIAIPVEAGATYVYDCMISYSAVSAANSALLFAWDAPSGTLLARNTQSYVAQPPTASGANTGSDIIMRRPANITQIPAGGTDTASPPTNFHSAYDRGTITVGSVGGLVVLQVRQQGSGSANQTILRGGNQTRCTFARIA